MRKSLALVLITMILFVVACSEGTQNVNGNNPPPTGSLPKKAEVPPPTPQPPATMRTDLVTDASAVFTIPSKDRPPHMMPYTDPVFNTKITRIGGDKGQRYTLLDGRSGLWGDDVRHRYQKDQPWSRDGSLIAIQNRGSSMSLLFLDGQTYEPRIHCPNYQVSDDKWNPSKDYPHIRVNMNKEGTEVTWFNVVQCEEVKKIKLPFVAAGIGKGEGNMTLDGRYVIVADSQDSNMYVLDMEKEILGPPRPIGNCGLDDCTTDWVSISPSGKYAVITYEGDHMRVFDVNLETLAITPRPTPLDTPTCSKGRHEDGFIFDIGHADMTLSPFDDNEDVLVGQLRGWCQKELDGVQLGRVIKIRLKDNKVTSLTEPSNEAYSHHISTRNYDRPGWAYVSYFEGKGNRFNNEVIAVKLDGSKEVQRLAHSHSSSKPYRNEVHTVPSPDGTRVIFASAWDIHCADLCGNPEQPKDYVIDARQ